MATPHLNLTRLRVALQRQPATLEDAACGRGGMCGLSSQAFPKFKSWHMMPRSIRALDGATSRRTS
jgi:hypothetical protein